MHAYTECSTAGDSRIYVIGTIYSNKLIYLNIVMINNLIYTF